MTMAGPRGGVPSPGTYYLYGARLLSDWRLPTTVRPSRALASVRLVSGSSTAIDNALRNAGGQRGRTTPADFWSHWTRLASGDDYLRHADLCEFLVSADGRVITARHLAPDPGRAFFTYLTGQALSYALVKQGLEPLHATVVTVAGQAIAFLGASGAGKSTLAAAFVAGGHRVLTDDQLVLGYRGAEVVAHAGPPRLKLFPAMASRLLGPGIDGARVTVVSPKLTIPLGRSLTSRTEAPLRAIYVIANPRSRTAHADVALRRLSQRQACLAIVRHTFNGRLVDPARLARQFAHAARLAAAVPVKRLTYPRSVARLGAVRDAVIADLAR